MDHSKPIAGRGCRDRLSHLDDAVLGHIMSFLDAEEVARTTALSRRWRDVLAIVHTVSLEKPDPPLLGYEVDIYYMSADTPARRPFNDAVTGALFARSRRPAPAPAAVPLRALLVSIRFYKADNDKSTVDQWVSYAQKHAARSGLELDLSFGWYSGYNDPDVAAVRQDEDKDKSVGGKLPETDVDDDSIRGLPDDDDNDDVVSSSSEEEFRTPSHLRGDGVYTVPWGLFSCAALRSLRLDTCRLTPPAGFSMPLVEAIHLSDVLDVEEHVQRLISACPRLADLTLEDCDRVTALSLLDNRRLRRLTLRSCHKLATVAVDASELCSFDYRGAVPSDSFITVRGRGLGSGDFPSVTSCKVDICGHCVKETTLVKLNSFMQKFASTKQLHLCSSRMGSCFARLPPIPALRHLQLHGRVAHDDNHAAAAAMSSILRQAPNLETLSLVFEVKRRDREYDNRSEWDLLDAHHLHYNQYDTLNVPAASVPVPPCLGSRVRKINLLHYQGGRAQRTLARFLLCNAAVLEKLYCGFAEGPLWIQTELMREMEGWVAKETASKEFR